MAEMYVQGVSTRKVTAIIEDLCGLEVTSTQVSRAAAELDEQLHAWRNRPIGEITYLVLDARYEKVRHDGAIQSCALLTAIGIDTDGKRSVLGCSVQLSEAEPHWKKFLESLLKRGMHGVKLVVSDDHAGLRAARQAVLAGVPWQRCQFHTIRNAMAHVPKVALRTEVAREIRPLFDADEPAEAKRRLKEVVTRYEKTAPQLAAWLEQAAVQWRGDAQSLGWSRSRGAAGKRMVRQAQNDCSGSRVTPGSRRARPTRRTAAWPPAVFATGVN